MAEIRSRILSLGTCLPERIVTNEDLTQYMDTSHDWIVERTGIEERRWVSGDETGSGMAAKACEQALERAGVDRSEVDLIVYATLSPDYAFPGSGMFLQRKLGINDCAVLDIRQQCTGFIYGLSIADSYIRSGMYKKVLVVGAEVHSTGLDKSTEGRDLAVLFGDGAGVALVGVSDSEDHRILSTHLHADGREAEILWIEFPSCANHPRITKQHLDEGRHYPKMQGRKVFKHAVTRMPQVIKEGLEKNGMTIDDIDMLIPHQANLRINEMVVKMMGISPDKVHNNIQKLGNTTAATIPLCLEDAMQLGKVKTGDTVCLVAFGAGLTWGSVFLKL